MVGGDGLHIGRPVQFASQLPEFQLSHVGLCRFVAALGFQFGGFQLGVGLLLLPAVGLVGQVLDVCLDRGEQVILGGAPLALDDALGLELLDAAVDTAENASLLPVWAVSSC